VLDHSDFVLGVKVSVGRNMEWEIQPRLPRTSYAASVNGPLFDLPTTMSKMLYLGMSFEEVLLRVAANPARIINRVSGI
jgi:hypothetical protein